MLIWHTGNVPDKWNVEVRTSRDSAWRSAGEVHSQVVSVPAGEPPTEVRMAPAEQAYNPEQQIDPASWQPFTDKFISQVHSLSVVDIAGKTFRLKQVSETGETLDSFRISK